MRYLSLMIAIIYFAGCGGSDGVPLVEQTIKENVIAKKDSGVKLKDVNKSKEASDRKTHIRVLKEDINSKIPEYLIKIPVKTD